MQTISVSELERMAKEASDEVHKTYPGIDQNRFASQWSAIFAGMIQGHLPADSTLGQTIFKASIGGGE